MALPKIDTPIFTLKLPSSNGKKNIKFRPFTVKEEKILLMAAQGKGEEEVLDSIKQVINNCLHTEIDIDNLPTYDIEYIFVNLRAKSVNNVIELTITDDEDEQAYTIPVNIDDIEVVFNEDHKYVIELNDNVSIMLKDPNYDMIQKLASYKEDDEAMMEMVISSIDKVLVGEDDVLLMKDHTRKEQEEFVNSLSSQNMRNIEDFLSTLPKLSHTIEYAREDGTKVEKIVEGMQSFFT
tara:strand:- start:518 stop:1228 length:711 start_codon:yes stop_codon:yes gene_type:complete